MHGSLLIGNFEEVRNHSMGFFKSLREAFNPPGAVENEPAEPVETTPPVEDNEPPVPVESRKSIEVVDSIRPVSDSERNLLSVLGVDADRTPRDQMAQATNYTCMKVLSESVGKLPLKLYQQTENGIITPPQTRIHKLVSLRPNDYMTACTFWSLMERCCQQYGNGFAFINSNFKSARYGGEYTVEGIYPMNPKDVRVFVDDTGFFGTRNCIFYEYTNPYTGDGYLFRNHEVLHFKTWDTKDGILGISVGERLAAMISGENAAEEFLSNLYRSGLSAKMVLQYASNLDNARIAELEKKFANRLMGPQAAGKVIPIPEGLELKSLNTSLVDADFTALRKFSALQIAAAYGVKNSFLNNYENSKYNSVETEQLAFLDSLSFRLKMYEEEINSKLLLPEEEDAGYYFKFNEKAILRTDSLTQSEILKNYTQGGIYSPNEARDYLEKPHIEGGDTLLVNGSYVPITEAGAAYQNRGGKNS